MLFRRIRGRSLVYLDNAATALKPQSVIEALVRYYTYCGANVARGVHTASQEATAEFEEVRGKVARWMGATPEEIVLTAGTTAGLNLVAQSFGGSRLGPGDEILVTEMEHHSNILPWQLVAERTGALVRAVPITDAGELDLDELRRLCSPRTRIVAVCHVSNVLGTVVPVRAVAAIAHEAGAVCVVDGAQAAPHLRIDVREMDCDFYVFSGHKVYGPTGIGVLYGRRELLGTMPPWQGGGGMIEAVTIERSTFAPPPVRFEAGTPPIAEVFGLGAALDYVAGWDRSAALSHEDALGRYAAERLAELRGVRLFGHAAHKVGVVSFTVDGIHAHDVGTALDADSVAVRAGHHCAQPLMSRFGVAAMVRASFAPYNLSSDVDALVAGVQRAQTVFGV
jgi:cysteine desulfurase/selenocysteine lyase